MAWAHLDQLDPFEAGDRLELGRDREREDLDAAPVRGEAEDVVGTTDEPD